MMLLVAVLAAVFAFSGCEKSYKQKNTDAVEKTEKVMKDKAEKAKKEKEKSAAEKKVTGDALCFGAEDANAPKEAFELEGKKYEIVSNYRFKALDGEAGKPIVIGLLSDIKNFIPKNIENLEGFYAEFKKAGVQAVIVTGDTSEKYEMIKPLFDFLAKKNLPTFVIMGNREKKEDYAKAAAEVHAAAKHFVDMNRIRVAELGPVTLVSLAGYHDANYIHNPPGCNYGPKEMETTQRLAEKAATPVILVMHGPAKGEGKDALDLAQEAGNVGDPQINALIAQAKIPFSVCGNIHEAGGKAVGKDFKTLVAQDTLVTNLYVNTGPADSDPWNMNDGSISKGMAGILTVQGKQAQYKIIKAK